MTAEIIFFMPFRNIHFRVNNPTALSISCAFLAHFLHMKEKEVMTGQVETRLSSIWTINDFNSFLNVGT